MTWYICGWAYVFKTAKHRTSGLMAVSNGVQCLCINLKHWAKQYGRPWWVFMIGCQAALQEGDDLGGEASKVHEDALL